MGMLVRATCLLTFVMLFVIGRSAVAETPRLLSANGPATRQPELAAKPTPTKQTSNIVVAPTSLEVSLPQGGSTVRTLTISNAGTSMLNASVQVSNATTAWQPLVFPKQKIAPELRARTAIAADSPSDMLVYLNEQADISGAYRISDWKARGQYVFNTLLSTAQRSQNSLIQQLDAQIPTGAVTSYEPFYIVNAVLVHARAATVTTLAARSDVAYVDAAHTHVLPQPTRDSNNAVKSVEWGVAKIGADQVWHDFDDRGEGVVVASIDSGVQGSHPALVRQYRGTATNSNNYNWYDPTGTSPAAPNDNNGHGTHTMGIMVGDDGGSNKIGVAPGATWIAAKGCATTTCEDADLLAAAQWVLAPFPIGGKPADGDASKRPNVVNNSWGGYGGIPWYQSTVQAWRAAAIFPAFVAGNFGPDDSTVGSPGDYAESFATGATDNNDQIAAFSGRGPSYLTDKIKPDVSAPGVDIRSSFNNSDYGLLSGTSMASPHTAGCVALILSVAPNLDVDTIEQLLTSTAVDEGSPGPDFTYGYGRIDCYAAVAAARSAASWLTLNPTKTSVAPGGNQTLTAHINATGLTGGTYNAQINITSNDPAQASVTIPVTLTVAQGPTLAIANNIPATSGELVDVPINLSSNGYNVTSATFSITYDHTCLTFDPTDKDGDGLADAIGFSLPPEFSGVTSLVSGNTGDEIVFTITPSGQTTSTLLDGVLTTITFQTICQPPSDQHISASVGFASSPAISSNDTDGHLLSTVSTTSDGSVLIGPPTAAIPTGTLPLQPTEETTPTPTQPRTPNNTYEVFLPSVER